MFEEMHSLSEEIRYILMKVLDTYKYVPTGFGRLFLLVSLLYLHS